MKTETSRILEEIHETAIDLHKQGFINKHSMERYDVLCGEKHPGRPSLKLLSILDLKGIETMI